MASELVDFRGKFTEETILALTAEEIAFNRDKSEIAREVMHAWALKKLHEHRVAARLMREEGFDGADEGKSGRTRE